MTKQKISRFFTVLERKMSRNAYDWCVQAMSSSALDAISDANAQNLTKIFSYLSYEKLSKAEEGYLMDIFSKVFLEETEFEFYERYLGSAGDYVINLESGQDYTGHLLVVRLDEDNLILSPDDIDGSADAVQTVPIDNLIFTSTNMLHKLRVQLESPLGESSQVLRDFYICLKLGDIDV
jgi:hypothetical protein